MTAPDPTTCPHCYHHPHVYPGRPPQAFSYPVPWCRHTDCECHEDACDVDFCALCGEAMMGEHACRFGGFAADVPLWTVCSGECEGCPDQGECPKEET